jgi:hypothetical protein
MTSNPSKPINTPTPTSEERVAWKAEVKAKIAHAQAEYEAMEQVEEEERKQVEEEKKRAEEEERRRHEEEERQ